MASNNVTSLHQGDRTVEPPDGWQASTPFGHLSSDGTKAGRLARLGDVLKWIEVGREWPRDEALKCLLNRLPVDAMGRIYRVQPGSFACKVSESESFGFPATQQRQEANRANSASALKSGAFASPEWLAEFAPVHRVSAPVALRPTADPGVPALRLLLSTCWSKPTTRDARTRADVCTTTMQGKAWQANYLAVPLLKAFEWWGYGRLVDAGIGEETGRDNLDLATGPASGWTDARIAARHAELKAAGERAPTLKLCEESGLSDREIRRAKARVKASGPLGQAVAVLATRPGNKRR
ncbi:hypothetical protein [Aquabacterium sp.]|uniref:hypothetical protein n=1 Tax=Aquabacterium sp. TaxID=1872578 RepID=UPI002E2EDCF9|nr:hypothetical protein [Aquabacterium sp.]HEX5310302.1 hypothetical protein [Aquabacterium sp.]